MNMCRYGPFAMFWHAVQERYHRLQEELLQSLPVLRGGEGLASIGLQLDASDQKLCLVTGVKAQCRPWASWHVAWAWDRVPDKLTNPMVSTLSLSLMLGMPRRRTALCTAGIRRIPARKSEPR